LALGTLIVIAGISTQLNSVLFWVGMFVIGLGFGLLASQINNVNMSAVDQSETSEVGGLQGTFQNMGTSLGTAVVGSFFILLMTSGFQSAVQSSTSLSQNQKSFITTQTKDGVQIVSKSAVQTSVMQHGGSAATAQTVADLYDQAQVRALKSALFIVFVVGVLSLLLSKRLPNEAVPVEK
jgi:fucose permease